MKKLINIPFAVLLCMAMTVTFTACETEEEAGKALTFLCGQTPITNGSTYTSTTLDEDSVFVPGIDLMGDAAGNVVVTVKSLNETTITICGFGSCLPTLPYLEYTATASGSISANTPCPLDIHYEPTKENPRAEALITAWYEGEEKNAISFTLVMNYE